MKLSSRAGTTLLFALGLFLVFLGMIIEFLLGSLLPGVIMQALWVNGGFLIFFILLFGGGFYFLRRSILGQWYYRYDSLIFAIAGTICIVSAIQTMGGLQVGHPYLFLIETNLILMYLLWIFVLPPMNPIVMMGLGGLLFLVTWINYRAFSISSTLPMDSGESQRIGHPLHWWQILANLTRISVWLGSIFLLILSFLILGGPPLSPPPNILLYNPEIWSNLALGLLSVILLNSAVFILNQISDVDTDQLHKDKAHLPISAGSIRSKNAAYLAFFFSLIGIFAALFLGPTFVLLMIGIFGFGILYSISPFRVKGRPFLDIMIIGIAFGLWAVLAAWVLLTAYPFLSIVPELPLTLLLGPTLFYGGTHCLHTVADFQADKQAGIKTTAVYLGPKKASRLGILLIGLGFLLLYSTVGFHTHLFWYGLLKYKSIFLLIFCGFPFFALYQQYRTWQQAKDADHGGIYRLQKMGRWVSYQLFLILVIYLLLYVFLFYPLYYPNYTFPWG